MKESSGITHVSFADAVAKGTPSPHTRDEVHFVARGEGFFVDGERRHSVGPGSFLFVPAGQEHRFEDFSADLVWAAFYGPEGGEQTKKLR